MLGLSVHDAVERFAGQPAIAAALRPVNEVGLGYLKLGEPTPSLSGGESQRLKIASRLRSSQEGALYVFDEPTTGLPDGSPRDGAFADIAAGCAARLRVLQGRPRRASDDWSIRLQPRGCTCELCDTLTAFLADRVRRVLEWPLRKDGRAHVHSRIDSAELPVTHVTRRTGRPFTLVLAKTERLFTAEQKERAAGAVSLEWLAVNWLRGPSSG